MAADAGPSHKETADFGKRDTRGTDSMSTQEHGTRRQNQNSYQLSHELLPDAKSRLDLT